MKATHFIAAQIGEQILGKSNRDLVRICCTEIAKFGIIASVKYWEIIAAKLSHAGRAWIVGAQKSRQRHVVQSDGASAYLASWSILKLLFGIAIALMVSSRLLSANLIVNPGFETGDFTGWTVSPAASLSSIAVVSGNAHSGTYAASFGATGVELDVISQTIATTPGTRYNLSFWLEIVNRNNEFQVSFGSVTLLHLIDTGSVNNPRYRQFRFSPRATGSSTTLGFAGLNPPSFTYLDDVSVIPSSSVSDSGSTAMLSSVTALALFVARRRFRRTA